MPFDFAGSSPESFFAIIISFFSPADLISFFLKFGEAGHEFVFLIEQFSKLSEKDCSGEVESAVLMIILKVDIFIFLVQHLLWSLNYYLISPSHYLTTFKYIIETYILDRCSGASATAKRLSKKEKKKKYFKHISKESKMPGQAPQDTPFISSPES